MKTPNQWKQAAGGEIGIRWRSPTWQHPKKLKPLNHWGSMTLFQATETAGHKYKNCPLKTMEAHFHHIIKKK